MILKHPKTGTEFYLSTRYVNDNPYNGGHRRDPRERKYVVLHHTAGSTPGDLSVLRGRTSIHVSVKYLVPDPQDGAYIKDGRFVIYQLLPDDVIGWSIGRSTGLYSYVTNANSDSIEVSNLGTGKDPFEAVQVEACEALIAYEEARLDQDLKVFGHRETSPGRKIDPHVDFPLDRVRDFAEWLKEGNAEMRDFYWAAVTVSSADKPGLLSLLDRMNVGCGLGTPIVKAGDANEAIVEFHIGTDKWGSVRSWLEQHGYTVGKAQTDAVLFDTRSPADNTVRDAYGKLIRRG